MSADEPVASKRRGLTETGTLNPASDRVADPKFREGEFFDPRDIVQVKYEMLRRVLVDDVPVGQAADEYGFSRPTYYQAKANFDGEGIAGLVPKKRGPHGAHKLRGHVLEFIRRVHVPGDPIRARELAVRIREDFGVEVHPRTIERALGKPRTP
jgi:transposase